MEKVELDKFWREGKADYSNYNQDQINNFIAFVIQENHDLQEVCETYEGLDLKFLKTSTAKVKSGKPIVIGAGRPSVLSEEAKTHIRSLKNVGSRNRKLKLLSKHKNGFERNKLR